MIPSNQSSSSSASSSASPPFTSKETHLVKSKLKIYTDQTKLKTQNSFIPIKPKPKICTYQAKPKNHSNKNRRNQVNQDQY